MPDSRVVLLPPVSHRGRSGSSVPLQFSFVSNTDPTAPAGGSLPHKMMEDLARLYDLQLRQHAAFYPNAGRGRLDSAAYLDRLFHELLALAQPHLFVEAGAYRAETSRRVRLDHPNCRVVAFEGNPYNVKSVTAELDLDSLGVDYRHCAVADQPGQQVFRLRRRVAGEEMRPVTGNSSLLPRVGDDTEYEEITVPAVSLDSEFAGVPGTAAAWIDVEGASRLVLAGANDFLDQCDLLMIEVEEVEQWRDQWLSLDVITHLLGRGFVPVARDIEYENQFNIVFAGHRFSRRPDVLLALQLHENFLVHHLARG